LRLEARLFFSFFRRVSYNMNCIAGLHNKSWDYPFPEAQHSSFFVQFLKLEEDQVRQPSPKLM